MSRTVYYMGFYSGPSDSLKRKNIRTNPAGTAKMEYITYALKSIGKKVVLLSIVGSKNTGFCTEERFVIDEQEQHVYIPSFVFRIFGKNVIRGDLLSLFIKRYFLSHICKDDIVIVYHSLAYKDVIIELHRKIGFRLILEVEEVYQDIIPCSAREKAMEQKILADAEGYIFSTDSLQERLNDKECPYIISNGPYFSQKDRRKHFPDNKIHCVYSGTLDPVKGGAAAAVAAADFLSKDYHVHILGFGEKKEEEQLLKQIELVNKKDQCEVTYHGLITGEDFICFLQKCQIGLSTQNPDKCYVNSSYPSKILTYLANGLRVVSANIPEVKRSRLGNIIYFYFQQDAKSIADVIKCVDMSVSYDSRRLIDELDQEFQKELNSLLKDIE